MNRYKVYVDIAGYKNKYVVVTGDTPDKAIERAKTTLNEIHGEYPTINSITLARRK